MTRRFTEEQFIGTLHKQRVGLLLKDLMRRHGILGHRSFSCWKPKYGGMEACDASCLKEHETENAKLNELLAEADQDNAALKESHNNEDKAGPTQSGEAGRRAKCGFEFDLDDAWPRLASSQSPGAESA